MFEELVAEYLAYDLPPIVGRKGGLDSLPAPRKRNLIHSVIGVRRCGKTFHLYQLIDELAKAGVPRRLLFYFPFDDDRLGEPDGDTASEVLNAYYGLVPEAKEGCYLFFDEIQELPGWEAFVRRAAERYAAVGSAGVSISNEATYTLLDGFEDVCLIFKAANYSLTIRDSPKSAHAVDSITPRGKGAELSAKYRSEVGNLEAAMAEAGLGESLLITIEEECDIALDAGVVHAAPAWKRFLPNVR